MKHKGKISGLLLGNTVAVTEWVALQDVITKLDSRSFYTVFIIYILQMILSCYFGYWYDKRSSGRLNTEVGGMASNDFVVDFFGKVAALSERDSRNITVYILSIKGWDGLKDTVQEKKLEVLVQKLECTIVKTIRKGDVVTKWDENKYVIVAIDNGHEKSTITNRLMKNIENEIENDLLSVSLLFGAASYPVEGKTFEELLRKAQNQLYHYRNLQENE
ncbi:MULTISPECIES: diguanylate cyclase domain-containing protein [Bacillus]|uniref:Diguanylate cyclase n=1 Tax=Bacillus cereus TaxID=1396 RepID=A0A2C1M6N7_BACCE|nr:MULTISPECIES: diguanylate cyclase [Bacillus]MDH4420173.1 diguanylate cyclase [Bacillus cereus]PER28497.1 diguanylate cyclase [Bacillus cereus]PFA65067.1 diguanylate cyclase [Bacillus sp. AFS015896]PGL87460.1 diguanylate cyclase [Bacillus sp. AFS054943]PGU05581.1 diguanylate cyclase [Bacillus cereus]